MILTCATRRPRTVHRPLRRCWTGFALLIGVCWLSPTNSSLAGVEDGRSVLDLEGHPVDPLDSGPAGTTIATVFVFVRMDCPISNRYAPEVQALQSQFSSNGIVFKLVYPDPDSTPAEIRRHVKEFGYDCTPLRDPLHHLAKLCRARVTPEAAVMMADGELIYHGRIDNRYVALGRWRPEPTRRDLEQTLTALLHGQPVPPSRRAVGCAITPLSSE